MDILVINGPNLGALGERQPGIYGSLGMDALPGLARKNIPDFDSRAELHFFQANGEGQLIDRLEEARKQGQNGLVINPGAYTHTSLALADCLAWINIPYVEVHLSNVQARDRIRRESLVAASALGTVAGFGLMSYVLGLQALLAHLEKPKTEE
ncbi:MAG: type II 3-dehydroquinate dehydratase [Desulfonatronovibrionaceae bacterium]